MEIDVIRPLLAQQKYKLARVAKIVYIVLLKTSTIV